MQNQLQESQYGFSPGRSTIDVIKKVLDIIREHKSEGKHICVISLNIKSAFNSFRWTAVLEELEIIFPANLYKLTKSFMEQRQIQYQQSGIIIGKLYNRG